MKRWRLWLRFITVYHIHSPLPSLFFIKYRVDCPFIYHDQRVSWTSGFSFSFFLLSILKIKPRSASKRVPLPLLEPHYTAYYSILQCALPVAQHT